MSRAASSRLPTTARSSLTLSRHLALPILSTTFRASSSSHVARWRSAAIVSSSSHSAAGRSSSIAATTGGATDGSLGASKSWTSSTSEVMLWMRGASPCTSGSGVDGAGGSGSERVSSSGNSFGALLGTASSGSTSSSAGAVW